MRRGRRGVQGNGRGQASHLIGCGPELLRWRRDCSVDEWHREVEERYHCKHLPRDAQAGGVLLDNEDHVAENEQDGQDEHGCAIRASRLSIRLHLGPVGAVADIGAVARVEACAPSRAQVARIDGCRVVNGVSALSCPLPLRYSAVVPAQNASGCAMPREVRRGFSTRKVKHRNT